MALGIGKHVLTIQEMTFEVLGDKKVMRVIGETEEGDPADCLIWLTVNSIESGVVDRQLKLCGFDRSRMKLKDIEDRGSLLAGNQVTILTEESNRGLRSSIMLNINMTKAQIDEVQKQLDARKGGGDDPDEIPF